MRRLALCVTFLIPMSCSWLFVQPLPDRYERGDVASCTSNAAAPVIDTLFTLTNVGSAVYVAGQDNVANKGAAVTAGLLVGTLWLSSAIYGYSHTAECRDAMEEADDRPTHHLARPRAAPPPPAAGYPGSAPSGNPVPAPMEKPDAPRFGG
jgi:hypothetical protein